MSTMIRVISDTDDERFQSSVNKFIIDKKILDIKYQTFPVATKYNNVGAPLNLVTVQKAMVVYEED